MFYFTLKLDDEVLGTYHFEDIKVVTMGRAPSNDIVINDKSVSGNHAKIEAFDNGYLITDLQSKNGIFVNKKFVSSHWLKNGDVIAIGKHVIDFGYKLDDQPQTVDQTMVLDMDSYKEMRADNFLRAAMGEGDDEIKADLVLINDNKRLDLSKKVVTIGRDPDSDVVVPGILVGKTAATVSKHVDGHYLSYVGGFTKPKVNDKVINDSILLKDASIIKIGGAIMRYVTRRK